MTHLKLSMQAVNGRWRSTQLACYKQMKKLIHASNIACVL